MTRSCKISFVRRGCFIFDKNIYIYINKKTPLKDHVLSRQRQVSEQTVHWEREKHPTQ